MEKSFYSRDENEIIAQKILMHLFPNRYKGLQIEDRPDLQDETVSAGIEVVSAVNNDDIEATKLFDLYIEAQGKRREEIRQKLKECGQSVGEGSIVSLNVVGKDELLRMIQDVVADKLKKLQYYRNFNENSLFIRCDSYIVKDYMDEISKAIIPYILEKQRAVRFDYVYLLSGLILLEIDVKHDKNRCIELSRTFMSNLL